MAEELRLKTNAEVNMKFQEVMAEEVRSISHSILLYMCQFCTHVTFLFSSFFHSSRVRCRVACLSFLPMHHVVPRLLYVCLHPFVDTRATLIFYTLAGPHQRELPRLRARTQADRDAHAAVAVAAGGRPESVRGACVSGLNAFWFVEPNGYSAWKSHYSVSLVTCDSVFPCISHLSFFSVLPHSRFP